MFKSRIICGIPPVDTQQTKCFYFLMLCQNHGPGAFLWHRGRVQEAEAGFSRVDSRDFHSVINERSGDSLWGRSGGSRIVGRLRQRLNGCQTAREIATNQSFLSQQIPIPQPWLSVMSCAPSPALPPPSSVVQNSFLEAWMFLFFFIGGNRWSDWFYMVGWGKHCRAHI